MSKLKIGFSALMMLILVSMFASWASAEDFVPTSTNPAPGIHVGDVNNQGEKATHKTHGNFQNNTNSCANCHSTHNGESAQLLKFSGSDYDLCLSCHDGTMGFYNVLGQGAGAGTFNDSHESASMHKVTSDVQVGSAPGAYENASTETFECSSCHNPHGTTNDRLLKYDDAQITLNLVENPNDPIAVAINAVTGEGGLKITESTGPTAGSKVSYSNFCASCHDAYLMGSGTARSQEVVDGMQVADGVSPGHYSHTTNNSSQGRNCAACHYAHGTDITLLMDTQGKKIADYMAPVEEGGLGWSEDKAIGYMKEVSGDSKLKKYTNMSVCYACHTSSHNEGIVGHGPENEGDEWNGPMPEQGGDPWAGTGEYWNWVWSSRHGWTPTMNGKAGIN